MNPLAEILSADAVLRNPCSTTKFRVIAELAELIRSGYPSRMRALGHAGLVDLPMTREALAPPALGRPVGASQSRSGRLRLVYGVLSNAPAGIAPDAITGKPFALFSLRMPPNARPKRRARALSRNTRLSGAAVTGVVRLGAPANEPVSDRLGHPVEGSG